MMTSETIRIARIAIFERGNIELVRHGRAGKMVALRPQGIAEADAYNELAALDAQLTRELAA